MSGHYTHCRSDAEKLSDCIRYITSGGGFHSFGQFLSTLLNDAPHLDQVVVQTVSHFFQEGNLKPFLNKVAEHRLMKAKDDLQSVVLSYGFCLSDPQQEGMSAISNDMFSSRSNKLWCRDREHTPTWSGDPDTLGS